MDFSKLNPAEWIKNIFKELENIRYCYFLAYLIVYVNVVLIPENISNKLGLVKYINLLSLIFIFALVILTGRIINFISLKIERFFYEKKILKYLETLNRDELRALSLGVIKNQQTVYMNFQDSAAESLLYKGLIAKCEGVRDTLTLWPYIIYDFVWNQIKNDNRFKELTMEEIIAGNNT